MKLIHSLAQVLGIVFFSLSLSAAPYTFLGGYNVLDEANSPGIGTNFAATTALKYGSFGADVESGIIYISRDMASTEDGRTNTVPGPVAVITTSEGFNGSNFTDTGLLDAEPNSQAIFASEGPVVVDAAKNRILVFGNGTNVFDFLGVVYSAARGTVGGAPAGGNPGAANRALTNLFHVPNDLTNSTGSLRGGVPLGMAARTADGVTTVYLAFGNHVEAWSDDAPNGAEQFPWRRVWATFRAPRQNTVSSRLASSDRVINGITVDDEGNCYFTVQFTDPPRIWRVPANAAQLAPEPVNLDFDDRAIGGSNSGTNAVVIPVITQLPAPAMLFSGTNSFVNPQHVTFFRTDGRAGLFVSSFFWMNGVNTPFTPYRSVVRLMLDAPGVDASGYPSQSASLVDAFGSSATPTGQDPILQSVQSSRSAAMSSDFGDTQPMKLYVVERMPVQVNTITNPTQLYFQAFVTDTNKGQTIPTAAIAIASIPPLPTFSITSVSLLDTNSVRIVWEATSNSVYSVEFRDDLFATNWTSLGTVTAMTASASFTNAGVATNAQRYFRVGRLP